MNASTDEGRMAGFRPPSRWQGVQRMYSPADVARLQGSVVPEHTFARRGAENLWNRLHTEPFVAALGAATGQQAVQQVRAGLKAIYVSGWQVAADANVTGQTYPDQSLYPANSVPALVKRINQALQRADQIEHAENKSDSPSESSSEASIDWFVPIVADAEAGFGGTLNVFELVKAIIEAGAAAVHLEDQLASEKKCGHMRCKVRVPTRTAISNLTAARLAADVSNVPTILIARTDAGSAALLTSDVDPRDCEFLTGERSPEGLFRVRCGIDQAIARALCYAPFVDLLWFETSTPDLLEAKKFADAVHEQFPGKLLAYNCSPSFNWKAKLDSAAIAKFQRELGAMGYKFQFVKLAGFHTLNYSMFMLARAYRDRGVAAYAELQEAEFVAEKRGYTATKHQHEVGAGYFDEVARVIAGGECSTTALA